MKRLIIAFLLIYVSAGWAYGQTTLSTSSGLVSFFSSAPLEDIKATNEKAMAVMNPSSGEILVRMRIKDFQFRKSLMQRHFNEEYLESHLYPDAQLTGRILDFDPEKLNQTPIEVVVLGNMTIHGVTRPFREKGTLKKVGNRIVCEAIFPIRISDYEVKIPRILVRNIAETVEVSVKIELK